ncbi:hypothetical protein HYT58_00390, partial [Candidatus Woesearchaeota archaeon]|nr:hypothetical protein [Candidatus Woesearchaeota archaeon]
NMSTNYTTTLISGVYTNRSVNSSVVGNNTVRIYANDTSGNKNNTEKRGFNVFVTPTVSLVNSIPSLVINDTEIKLNASIVFNGTGSVVADIKYTNGTFWQNISLSNPSGNEWNGTVPWNWNVTGTYNFTILANDSNGGRNYTEKYYYTPFLNITTPNGNAIDGNFSDWENKTNTTDEAGDIFGGGPSSHDMINVKIDNNGTHMFFFINVSGNIDNSDGTRYYRIYLSNGSQAAPNGNDTAPNNLERTAANYTYRIQINGSYFNGVDPCGIYNWTGSRTANCSFKNGSKEIEAMVAFDDINSSNVRIYHNITFETGNSTDRYDVAPNYKSFIQFVTGDAVLGVIGFVYPVNNTVYFVGGNYPYSFNFTCNYSVTGGGTASIVANWSYKIATFASNYQLVNGSDSNLSGNSTNGTITANGIAAGSYSFRQEVNTTGRNETFILRCGAVSGTTRLSTEERTIYVNRTPDYNGSVRVYGAFDGVRNATTLEGGTVTLLNDRRWNLSMQFLMNQTDTIPNLTVHNIILSGANFSNNISLVADELNGSIVDANLSNGTVYSNKTWKEYNFTDINGSFGNPAVQLHNFSNNSVFDQEVEKTYRADGESEANATSYKAIAYDDGDYINMTLGDDSNRVTARYLFKLDENEEAIDNFTVRWVGSGGVGIGALRSVQAFLFAWNFTEMNWTKLGSTTASLDGNITYSISGRSGIREFINESSGEITFVVRSSNFILPSEVALSLPSNVLTDYIQLTTGLNSSSVHWHPRIGYAYSDIENNEGFNLTYRLDPQNVTDNMSINLTFGSRGKAQNFSYTINLINPPAGAANNAPYLRSMNLLPTNPNTTDQFNCTFVVQDNESTSLDVNVTWYNGTAWFNSSIITVTNASNASRFLEAGVQARPNNWTCSIKATDGGGLLSDNRNDSAVVVNSQPTAVGLRDPLNDNHTTNRTPFFYWTNTTDADDDSNFTFTINLTCYLIAGGLCSPNDNKLVNTSDTGINLTNSQQLRFFFDDGAFYNWTVTAYDNNGTSGLSGINMSRNISIDVVVDVTMPNSTVQFGNKSIGNSDDTTDNSPQPAAIQNNGNSFIDVNESGVQADIDMWVTDAVPTSNYQFRMDN